MKEHISFILFAACIIVSGCASLENEKASEAAQAEAPWPSEGKVRVAKLFSEAIFAYQKKRYSETMAISKTILTIDAPDDPNYRWEAEQLYQSARLRSCEQDLKRRPTDTKAKNCVAEIHRKNPKWKEGNGEKVLN